MNHLRICFVLIFIMTITTYGESSSGIKKSFNRKIEPIIIKGEACAELIGQPIPKYGLFALKKGRLAPIPFQIDERDEEGNFVLTHGEDKTTDSDKGLFDKNDELVFMAMDSGDKIKNDKIIPGDAQKCVELEITDPVTSGKGWVYLLLIDKPQTFSKIDYVNYNVKEMKITAQNYLAQFTKKQPVVASKYAFMKGLGGDGTDIIDRVKLRVKMKLLFATLDRNEEEIEVTEYGHIDGSVRVIIHTRNVTPLILGIPASSSYQDTIYYYTYADFPFAISFPVRPTGLSVKIIHDHVNCNGWKFYSSTNPGGITIDGKMDDSDKKLDLSPWKWNVLSNEKFAFWTRCFAPPSSTVKVNLYYNDDINAKDDMEDITGENPGVGYDFSEGWLDLEEDFIEFRINDFYTKGYKPGMEKEIINVHDHPLTVLIKKIK